MAMRTSSAGLTATIALLAAALVRPLPAGAVVIDFDGLPAGTVVDSSVLPPGVTLDVTNNNAAHTPAAIIFDSSCPGGFCTGEDYDLMTPGAGVGNDTSQNKVLIIAEDLVDDSPMDGLIDDPDDEGMGGTMLLSFPYPVTIESVRVTDIDTNEGGSYLRVNLAAGGDQTVMLQVLGNNSGQTAVFVDPQPANSLYVYFRGSGSIDDIVIAEECGNGIVDPGEECDPPNGTTCDENCMLTGEPSCGDDVINQPTEDCDGTDLGDCEAGCEEDCTCTPFCGDGMIQPGEECDPPDGSTCDDNCMSIGEGTCGDNVINQPSEECDGTAPGDCGMGCEPDCTCTPYCGDGNLDPGEQCDPPDGGVSCDENCNAIEDNPFCGDNEVNQEFELCDGTDLGGCEMGCEEDCTCTPYCGDGEVNQPEEECDGFFAPGDCQMGCEEDCTCTPFCGDGNVDPGEQCDPPNGSTCDDNCMTIVEPMCGDGEINQPSEECDGADLGDCPNGCEGDCTCSPYCGDGNTDPGEECDPPDGVTCDENCMTLPYCGDGVVNQTSETCDGADAEVCTGECRMDCTCCGDGTIQAPEECDPPDGMTCDDTCMALPYCGDGMVNGPDEECDGADKGVCGMGCEMDCTCTPYCGDGNVDPGEECDPPEIGVEICNNDVDDDGDGKIDCHDPDCGPTEPQRCNGDCELVDPCEKILKDPAEIKFDVTEDGVDSFTLHGNYHLRRTADLGSEGFTLSLANANGTIYFAKLVPGELRRKAGGKGRYVFWDKSARNGGPGEADGLYRVVVRIRPKNGNLVCAFRVKAYGDFSAATEALMTTQITAGANAASLTAPWRRTNRGWKLRQRFFD